jgi:hypothetical protein
LYFYPAAHPPASLPVHGSALPSARRTHRALQNENLRPAGPKPQLDHGTADPELDVRSGLAERGVDQDADTGTSGEEPLHPSSTAAGAVVVGIQPFNHNKVRLRRHCGRLQPQPCHPTRTLSPRRVSLKRAGGAAVRRASSLDARRDVRGWVRPKRGKKLSGRSLHWTGIRTCHV